MRWLDTTDVNAMMATGVDFIWHIKPDDQLIWRDAANDQL